MSSKIFINAIDPEECRIAKVTEGKLEEFHIENAAKEITHGNIYKGIITRVEPGLQSVFVDYGAERHGFLQKQEIHPDYFLDTPSGDQSIKNIVKRGQELLVQVSKDPVMKKGAMLSTYISLPGRYIVLMPGTDNIGVSRKIEKEEERLRLKGLVEKMKLPQGFGLIVRTAGANCTKTDLAKDLRYLLRLWKNISKKGIGEDAPSLLYKERNLVLRSIRDYLTPEVDEIVIDDEAVHHEVRDFINIISPKHTRIVKLHQSPGPIFARFNLEDQISRIFESRVELKSGGSVVIEQTEALVAIDVNSGKGIHKKSIEQTALATNLDAAEEIARQLRLRDMGGLIVVDFIDMRESRHRLEVEKALKNHMKEDKARTKIGRISKFGLLELSRQRIRPSIEFGSYLPCRHCRGKGMLPSAETQALGLLRKLQLETLKDGITEITGVVPANVADYLLNNKRKEILDLEMRREISIRIEGDADMMPKESRILRRP
ncbi:MAG: Rne/Rng family ribonuclease [Desulfococcaceae bacterium]|jgi:ribonuclease E|nr:Rne/Rng family ribonuclease [Desulfococcaceae bacterium]